MSSNNNLSFAFSGRTLGLLETPVKDKEHTYHAFRKGATATMYGEQIPALAETLPAFVVIDGITIALVHGLTAEFDYKTKATIPAADRRPRASAQGTETFPTIGEERSFSVALSVTKAGTWNVKASVRRVASVSPEDRKATAQTKAQANLAALEALFSA